MRRAASLSPVFVRRGRAGHFWPEMGDPPKPRPPPTDIRVGRQGRSHPQERGRPRTALAEPVQKAM